LWIFVSEIGLLGFIPMVAFVFYFFFRESLLSPFFGSFSAWVSIRVNLYVLYLDVRRLIAKSEMVLLGDWSFLIQSVYVF